MATVDSIIESVKDWKPERLGELVDRLQALMGEDAGVRISDFFRAVGNGVVSAQRELDQDSLAYVQARLPIGPPTAFRIPKVSAEFQFAMEWSKGSKFNVLVYGRNENLKKLQQNKVSFEIMAAPPDPTLVSDVAASPVLASLVLAPTERSALLEHLRALAKETTKAAEKAALEQFAKADNFDRVLVFRYQERSPTGGERGPERYSLVLVEAREGSRRGQKFVDVWLDALGVPKPGSDGPIEIGSDSTDVGLKKIGNREWWVGIILLDVADWQAGLMPLLRRGGGGG